jgi:hypothetical protein
VFLHTATLLRQPGELLSTALKNLSACLLFHDGGGCHLFPTKEKKLKKKVDTVGRTQSRRPPSIETAGVSRIPNAAWREY